MNYMMMASRGEVKYVERRWDCDVRCVKLE